LKSARNSDNYYAALFAIALTSNNQQNVLGLIIIFTSFDLDVCGNVVSVVVVTDFLFLSSISIISWLACVTCSCTFLILLKKLVSKNKIKILKIGGS
jgi:hypothetical protein